MLCFREVEEEKQRQKRERRLLEESLQMARQNEDAKQAFFRNMSHDMRTPLNAVLGSCELARQHLDEPERVAGYLDKIDSSGQYLLGLINDILEMARMESGQVRLEQRQFDLKGCVEECMSTFRIQAEKEGKNLVEHFHVRRTSLLGDTFRIQQVLNNLLSNAFKFTPKNGTITLSIEQLDNEEYAKYKFVIADTGIGMSAGFLDRIFEPYSREMRFSERQAAGTGLGMSITKNLVSQMGGEIQVESTPGEGSTFTVFLPLPPTRFLRTSRPLPLPEWTRMSPNPLISACCVRRWGGSLSAARTAGTTAGKRPDQARPRYAWTSHRESGHPAARADVPRLFGADSRSGVLPGEAGRKAQACRYAGGGTDRCERSGVRLENFIVLSKMLENMGAAQRWRKGPKRSG